MANEKWLDLIDRKALGIGRCNPDAFPLQNRGYCAGWNGVINLLEQAPRVDAVEVVRCEACTYAKPYTRMDAKTGFYCTHQKCTLRYGTNWERLYMPIKEAGDFCSYGEKNTAKMDGGNEDG